MPLLQKIYPTNNGNWSPGTYPPLCRVRHNNASWVNGVETDQEPSDESTDWQLEARDGASQETVSALAERVSALETAVASLSAEPMIVTAEDEEHLPSPSVFGDRIGIVVIPEE